MMPNPSAIKRRLNSLPGAQGQKNRRRAGKRCCAPHEPCVFSYMFDEQRRLELLEKKMQGKDL
jgi:hypothetical protein